LIQTTGRPNLKLVLQPVERNKALYFFSKKDVLLVTGLKVKGHRDLVLIYLISGASRTTSYQTRLIFYTGG
jgi:hypothetical protein